MDLQLVYPELCVNVHKLLAAGGLASSSGRLVCLERSEGFFINVDRKSPEHLPTFYGCCRVWFCNNSWKDHTSDPTT